MDDTALIIVSRVALGLSLAATAGLRAFLPLFVVGVAARFGIPNLLEGGPFATSDGFAWLASDAALVILGVAVVAEVLADKIPVVDNLLDLVALVIKPAAGALAAASVLGLDAPMAALLAGAALGVLPAAFVQQAKAKIRLLSSTTTGGLGNPVLSFLEDVLALAGTVVAVIFSLLAALIVVTGIALTLSAFRTFRMRRDRIADHLGERRAAVDR